MATRNWHATNNYGYASNTAERLTQNWHRDTAVVVAGMSMDEQLEAAGLNWEVLTSGFRYGDRYQFRQTETKVAFRSDNGTFIDTYTSRQPWQNRDIIQHFHDFCTESELGLEVSHIGSLQDGKLIYAAAKLPNVTDIRNTGDITEWWLLLKDSHLNGQGLQISLYANRMICTNGLHELIRQGNQVIAHLGSFNRERINGVLAAAIATLQQKEEQHEQLAAITMTVEEATLQLLNAFGEPGKPVEEQPKLIQTALKLFQGQAKGSEYLSAYQTAYGLLQSVTEYFNWHAPNRGGSQGAFQSVLSGTRGQRMQQFERQLVSVYLQ
jgi:hypothetical protein